MIVFFLTNNHSCQNQIVFFFELSVYSRNVEIVDELIAKIKQEYDCMSKCFDCYSNEDKDANWFEIVCRRPHCIVWAKLEGFPYWPAKVMSVDQSEDRVDVYFFGDHTYASISTSKCYLYSGVKRGRKCSPLEKYSEDVALGFDDTDTASELDETDEETQNETLKEGLEKALKVSHF